MLARKAVRFSPLVLALLIAGCDNDHPVEPEDARIQVSPLSFGIAEGDTIRLTATLGGEPAEVTWESSDEAVATIDATGLVTGVSGGTASATAALVSNPQVMRSASVTVIAIPELTSGEPVTGIASSGARGSGLFYKIEVPAGATALAVTLSGGTGDVDLYLGHGGRPSNLEADCWSFNAGNDEACTIDDPAAGWWYILLDLWDPYTGVTLTATVTP
jgi:hypothetical protein